MSKSINPFAEYQVEKVKRRESLIVKHLAALRRTRAKFQCVTDLAKAVAEQIAILEMKPCSSSTLLRNQHYKALLLKFLATQPGIDSLKVTSATDNTTKLLLNVAELEKGNLKRENERLKSYVRSLEKKLDEINQNIFIPSPHADESADKREIDNLVSKYAMVCKSLWLVLEHFHELVNVDVDGGRIIDLSAPRSKNVIVDIDATEPFIEWLLVNKHILK